MLKVCGDGYRLSKKRAKVCGGRDPREYGGEIMCDVDGVNALALDATGDYAGKTIVAILPDTGERYLSLDD